MKYAFITNLYPPFSRGGAEQVVQRTVRELHARGHAVCVISTTPFRPRLPGKVSEEREETVERVYRFFPSNLYHSLDDYRFSIPVRFLWHLIDLFSPSPFRHVRHLLEEEKPDLVFTHNLKGIGLRIPQIIQSLGFPHLHTLHDVQLSEPSGLILHGRKESFFHLFFRRIYEACVRWAIGTPDLVISPSQFLANFYRDRGFFSNTEMRTLPNPPPPFLFHDRSPRREGPLRLLYASQLERSKGILLLLEALDRSGLAFELHIAGDGTLAQTLAQRAREDRRVSYHGFVSIESLQVLLERCDACVVPSLCVENSPSIIYESLQAGVPVIASAIGGIGEIVKDGKNGLLVRPGDADALAEALYRFKDRLSFFWEQAEEIHFSVADFSLEHYVDRLEQWAREIVGRKKKLNGKIRDV
ncbi:MAG TPA: glycosyltransferase [Patescibacteria group bacterium]|nr:glycosyltransferase [Patescibacteria group bacterium]